MTYQTLTEADLLSRILYQDAMIIVLNKPQGIPVHPGPRREGVSLEDYFDALCFDYHHPPHLAHRLDRDTSGCLVLGRHTKALRKLGKLFENRQITKTYWAIVHGAPPENSGILDTWLEKVKTPKGWYMRVCGQKAEAQQAITEWEVLKQGDGFSWISFKPQTGRTHQLRVHAKHLGCPMIGDWIYGLPEDDGLPLHLHARDITLPLYHNQEPLTVTAPPPSCFTKYIQS